MKTISKITLVLGLFFTTFFCVSSSAQDAASPVTNSMSNQDRLRALELCHQYFEKTLSSANLQQVDSEINNIRIQMQAANETPLTPSQLDTYIMQNPADQDVAAYLKVLAILVEPVMLHGRVLTAGEIPNYQNALNNYANSISQKL